jgi:protein-disulfide isomerase
MRRKWVWAGLLSMVACAGAAAPPPPPPAPPPVAGPVLQVAAESPDARESVPSDGPSTVVQPTAAAVPVLADDAIVGNATAPVTVVAFLDLQCPFSARVWPLLQELRRRYGPSQLRLVIKHHPLPFHQRALPAARVARIVF